jgi:hypothetical protein
MAKEGAGNPIDWTKRCPVCAEAARQAKLTSDRLETWRKRQAQEDALRRAGLRRRPE